MKRLVSVLVLLAVLTLPQRAMAATVLLSAVTTTGASTAYPIATATTVRVQVWSAAGSTATVLIQVRSDDSNSPYYTVATITDPSSTGEYWAVPVSGFVRVNVTARSAGSISANLEAYRGASRIW